MIGVLMVAGIIVIVPATVWHYAGYFTGRYDPPNPVSPKGPRLMNPELKSRCPHGRSVTSRRDNPCPGSLPGCSIQALVDAGYATWTVTSDPDHGTQPHIVPTDAAESRPGP